MSSKHFPAHIIALYLTTGLCVIWLISNEFHHLSFNRNLLETLDKQHQINTTLGDYVDTVVDHINDRTEGVNLQLDKLEGRMDILDESINKNTKRKTRINKAISTIKQILSKSESPPGCPKTPTPGELWTISAAIIDSSDEYAVPSSLIAAVIRQESDFCNLAVSSAGAKGYMQLMPETAAEVANDVRGKNKRTLRIWRGRDNIQMGTAYLSQMILEFGGDIELAIKAYNAGPIHIKRVLAGERRLYEETEEYVKRVLIFKEKFERLGLQ